MLLVHVARKIELDIIVRAEGNEGVRLFGILHGVVVLEELRRSVGGVVGADDFGVRVCPRCCLELFVLLGTEGSGTGIQKVEAVACDHKAEEACPGIGIVFKVVPAVVVQVVVAGRRVNLIAEQGFQRAAPGLVVLPLVFIVAVFYDVTGTDREGRRNGHRVLQFQHFCIEGCIVARVACAVVSEVYVRSNDERKLPPVQDIVYRPGNIVQIVNPVADGRTMAKDLVQAQFNRLAGGGEHEEGCSEC